jgi:hypothetical protein
MTWQVRVWSGNRLERSTVAFEGAPAAAARYYAKRRHVMLRGFIMLIGHDGHAVETHYATHSVH